MEASSAAERQRLFEDLKACQERELALRKELEASRAVEVGRGTAICDIIAFNSRLSYI